MDLGFPNDNTSEVTVEVNKNYGGWYFYNLIYLPIEVNGKIWLNYNLGAKYVRVTHEDFNPTKQFLRTNGTIDNHDFFSEEHIHYLGKYFQWQRPADGHKVRVHYIKK